MVLFSQAILKRVAAGSLAAATGLACVGLPELPETLFEALMSPSATDLDDADRVRLIGLMAQDRRPRIRALAATGLGQLAGPHIDAIAHTVERLAGDSRREVRQALSATLPQLLAHLPALQRTELIAHLAVSENARHRQVLRAASLDPNLALGVRTARKHLA